MNKINDLPIVSVIIPVYNAEQIIADCLEKLTIQSYPREKTEIIIVNNNSTDNSQKIIEKYDVISVIEKKRGPSAARNTGIRLSKGEIIIFTDSDCLADKDFIKEHVRMHSHFKYTNREYKIIGGGISGHNSNIWSKCDDILGWHFCSPLLPPREVRLFLPTANLSVSREVLFNEGIFFDEDLFPGEDLALCVALKRKGYKIYFHPGARITHINRTTFKGVLDHCLGWIKPELALREKGIRPHKPKPFVLWVLCYIFQYIIVVGSISLYIIISRRYKYLFFMPIISFILIFVQIQLFIVEMQYRRQYNKEIKTELSE